MYAPHNLVITDDNVLEMWYGARKYDVGALELRCINYCITHMINSTHACNVFKACCMFEYSRPTAEAAAAEEAGEDYDDDSKVDEVLYLQEALLYQITGLISMDTRAVINAPAFLNLSRVRRFIHLAITLLSTWHSMLLGLCFRRVDVWLPSLCHYRLYLLPCDSNSPIVYTSNNNINIYYLYSRALLPSTI